MFKVCEQVLALDSPHESSDWPGNFLDTVAAPWQLAWDWIELANVKFWGTWLVSII